LINRQTLKKDKRSGNCRTFINEIPQTTVTIEEETVDTLEAEPEPFLPPRS
jgi:hypothetical protein